MNDKHADDALQYISNGRSGSGLLQTGEEIELYESSCNLDAYQDKGYSMASQNSYRKIATAPSLYTTGGTASIYYSQPIHDSMMGSAAGEPTVVTTALNSIHRTGSFDQRLSKALMTEAEYRGGAILLDPVPKEKRLHIAFEDLNAWVTTQQGKLFRRRQTEEVRQILSCISGCCQAGEVLALMGPSGSGKTSLLSVLGGRTPQSVKMEGTVLFNDAKLTKGVKKRLGYVLQDDLLYVSLTPYDSLYYAAMLRLPATMTKAEKLERVEAVITTLGLTRCRNTITGGGLLTGFFRGISGGERKRVSVGVELLIDPSAVFLDEPTSGLDSTTAMHLLTTLRKLAEGGRSIITTIHQPASRLYCQLDKLLLLSEGHVVYFGRAMEAGRWFGRLGYQLPHGISQADFIVDIASGEVSTAKIRGEEARLHCIACAEKFLESHPEGYIDATQIKKSVFGTGLWLAAKVTKKADRMTTGEWRGMDSIADLPESQDDVEAQKQMANERFDGGSALGDNAAIAKDAYGASWSQQYFILLSRSLKARRFEAISPQDISLIILIGTLTGLFWLLSGRTDTIWGARNTNGMIFFALMFCSMKAMFTALFVFPPEFALIVKERASGQYQISAYYLARMTSDLPIDCGLPVVFIVIVYFVGGLAVSPAQFFETAVTVVLFVLTAQSCGLFIGAMVPLLKTAQTLTTMINLTMMLTAGFFAQNIRPWIGWLKFTSIVWYAYNLILKIQYRGRDLWDCGFTTTQWHDSLPPGTCTFVPNGAPVKTGLHLDQNPNDLPWEGAALIGLFFFSRVAVFMGLSWKTSSKVR